MFTRMKSMNAFGLLVILILVAGLAACNAATPAAPAPTQPPAVQPTTAPSEEPEMSDVPRPSNGGGTGPAVGLTGDASAGATIFATTCVPCHGQEGKGGVPNAGSTDGTIPPLNPIDPGLVSSDMKTFASNLDLFIEHGSTPEGTSPQVSMLPFGDSKQLTPQQIADVIAYVISLNKK